MVLESVYYVGERANKRYPQLPIGMRLVPDQTADIYRVLAKGEKFFKPEFGDTLYGFSFFDIEREDPLSREVRGPWEHTNVVRVARDRLPDGDIYRVVTHRISGSVLADTVLIVDDRCDYDSLFDEATKNDMLANIKESIDSDANYIRHPGELKLIMA